VSDQIWLLDSQFASQDILESITMLDVCARCGKRRLKTSKVPATFSGLKMYELHLFTNICHHVTAPNVAAVANNALSMQKAKNKMPPE
jgi:hypothetical protein